MGEEFPKVEKSNEMEDIQTENKRKKSDSKDNTRKLSKNSNKNESNEDVVCAFIGGIPYSCDEDYMSKWLKENKIKFSSIDMPKFEDLGRPKGLAFVYLDNDNLAILMKLDKV